jgi:bacillaene synthase trans-acting acyltransferase
MFSGQGSHYRRMGEALFEKEPVFSRWMREGDRLVRKQLGFSLLEELYGGGRKISDLFSNTRATHPAIFVVEYAAAQTLLARGLEPDYVLGASMGSFAALAVAGVMPFEEALSAVIHQALCLEKFCRPGGMIAVMAESDLFERADYLHSQSVLAGVNFPRHFVVSALRENIARIEERLKQSEITHQVLAVSYAFHSPWMEDAGPAVCEYLAAVPRRPWQIAIICSARASMLSEVPPAYLWKVGREPVRLLETIAYLESSGSWTYVDLGPSGTLATFVKYNLKPHARSTVYPLLTPFGGELGKLDSLLAATSAMGTLPIRASI